MTILEQINQFSGSHIIGIDTLTEVKLTGGKSNPLQGKVTKLSEGNRVMLFKSGIGFKNMVNKKLEKQNQETLTTLDLFELITGGSTYEPGPRPWGQRIPNSPFVEHKGKQYLEVVFVEAGTSRYFIGDREIDKSEIAEMLPNKTEGVQGGLRDKVIIRTFAIDSIVRIRKSGTTIPVNETA